MENLAEQVIAELTRRGDWSNADQLIDLAPIVETPVVAYRHELDDPEHDPGFGQDVTGLAETQPGGTRNMPDRNLLIETLQGLVRDGKAEQRTGAGGVREYRVS